MSDTSDGSGIHLRSQDPNRNLDRAAGGEPPWWRKAVPVWAVAVIAMVALGVGLVAGVADTDDSADAASGGDSGADGDDASPDNAEPGRVTTTSSRPPRTTTTTRPTTTTTTAPEGGTRTNPFPLGTPLVTTSGIEVTVVGVDMNPAAAIAGENRFNDEAPAGMRYVLVQLAVSNGSDAPIHPRWELRVNAIGSQNRVHETCRAVLPDDISRAPELYPGGSATGNECVVVPEDEIADGSLLLMVAPSFGDPVFIRP